MASHERGVELVASLGSVKELLRRVRRDLPDQGCHVGFLVLGALRGTGPIRLRDLADEIALDLSTASRLIAALTERGWVERRPNPRDGRSCLLAITPDGERRYRLTLSAAAAAVEPALRDWSDEDVARLSGLLARLHGSFRSRTDPAADRTHA